MNGDQEERMIRIMEEIRLHLKSIDKAITNLDKEGIHVFLQKGDYRE